MGFFRPAPPSTAAGGGLSQAEADALYDAIGAAATAQAAAIAAAASDATTKADAAKARSTHTGTQLASTISDLTEAIQDVVGALALGGSGLTATYNDGANTLVLDVNTDGTTLEVSADNVRVKDAGISRAKLASVLAQDCIQVAVTDLTTSLATGDGQAWWVVPSHLNGLKLKSVSIALTVAQSSSGAPQMQMANVTQGWDLLSTRPVIAANKWLDTETGGTAAVVDTASSHDVLTTGDRIRFDIDTAGTGAKGLLASFYVGS